MAKSKKKNRAEIKAVEDRLAGGDASDTVCIFIPSETRKKKRIEDQEQWAESALRLFGQLFDGATAFLNLRGVYHPDDLPEPLFDDPIMVQSLADRSKISNTDNLIKLSDFCHYMGKELNQESIGLIINDRYIDIPIARAS